MSAYHRVKVRRWRVLLGFLAGRYTVLDPADPREARIIAHIRANESEASWTG